MNYMIRLLTLGGTKEVERIRVLFFFFLNIYLFRLRCLS